MHNPLASGQKRKGFLANNSSNSQAFVGFNKCTKNRPEVANLESRPFDALLWEELCKIVGGIVFP